ncbi:MAG: apolipoprotein D and lipocalin family protein [Sulfurimonas sp.]|jgi:apolipoprotein D and lipocalin family protein
MRNILLPFIALLFTACSTLQVPLKTVEHVQLDKYLGTWYEIARYEHSFEVGCSDVSATYSLKENEKINVVNSCKKEDGTISIVTGEAYVTDETNSKLKVTFFWPFYGDYWIVILGENYEYVVIGEPTREYFWILSREKSLDDKVKKEILASLPNLGYDEEKLIWTKQK